MAADDDLRLAWLAEREGRPGRRDALLTLAAAAGPEGNGWADRVRDRLVASRPDHSFARFATLAEALDCPRVVAKLARLREQYPPGRVRWLLARADAARGPYLGRRPALRALLDDLLAPPVPRRRPRHAPTATLAQAVGLPASDGPLVPFYLSVLLAIAALLDSVLRTPGRESRAA